MSSQGLLRSFTVRGNGYSVVKPDSKRDPNGKRGIMKDTTIYEEIERFKRTGYWMEVDSEGLVWTGIYKNEKRHLDWFKGYFYIPAKDSSKTEYEINIRPFESYYYKNGIQTKGKPDSLWPLLKGRWSSKDYFGDDSVIDFIRERWGGIRLSFVSQDSMTMASGVDTFTQCRWEQNGDQIIWLSAAGTITFHVVKLDKDNLILSLELDIEKYKKPKSLKDVTSRPLTERN